MADTTNKADSAASEAHPNSPRVERCIAEVQARFPGTSPKALAQYFEEVHQHLAPLARDLERELTEAKAIADAALDQLAPKRAAARIAELERQNGELVKALNDIAWGRSPGPIKDATKWVERHEARATAAIASAAGKEAPHDAKCTCDDCCRRRRPNPADGAPNPPGYRPYA